MKQQARIYYRSEQRNLMWDRWQKGDSMRVPGLMIFCGFYADREVAVFRTKFSNYSHRPFWIARFIRGEPVRASEGRVELIEDGQ